MKIIAAVLSYKMKELTNRTVEGMIRYGFDLGKDLFVFENQKDPVGVVTPGAENEDFSKYVTHFTGSNLRMTGGFNFICDAVDAMKEKPDVLWLCTNDFEITSLRPPSIQEAIRRAFEYPGPRGMEAPLGVYHPTLEDIPGYAYPWMFRSRTNGMFIPPVQMVDFICPALSWDFMKSLKSRFGFWFDPRFHRGWGIDYETCFMARKAGLRVRVDADFTIRHEASKTYISGAAPESKQQFYDLALAEMRITMSDKYGPNWYQKLMEHV